MKIGVSDIRNQSKKNDLTTSFKVQLDPLKILKKYGKKNKKTLFQLAVNPFLGLISGIRKSEFRIYVYQNRIQIEFQNYYHTWGLVINNVESLLGLERPHFFSENKAPDSIWKAFFPADAVLSPLNKHWGDPDRLWLLKKKFVKSKYCK